MKTQSSAISATQALQQTERVVMSRVFARAGRSQRFLRYLVAAALADPPQLVKEYAIATDVFDRDPSYDPAIDATVRVEAGRLRTRLRDYYDDEGREDPLLIEFPKGAYRVVLTLRSDEAQEAAAAESLRLVSPSVEVAAMGAPAASASGPFDAVPAAPVEQPTTNPRRRWSGGSLQRFYALPLLCFALLLGYAAWRLSRPDPSRPAIRAIAVLPLKNLSGDPGQDYFADGTTDELITELASLPGLRVVSWNSVMQEKDTKKSLKAIADELHADVLVEGSVARSGDQVRINTQLIDTRTDTHLWSSSFEGGANGIIALENRAAQEIVAHMQSAVASRPASARPVRPITAIDPAAHDAYLRGKNDFDKRQGRAAAEEFQRAIDLDPTYASAYAGLGTALESEALLGEAAPSQVVPRAMAAVQKSLELDPQNGNAMIARGSLETSFLWQWQAAERDLTRGVALSPNNAYGHLMLSVYFDAMGQPDEAVRQMEAAVEIDPLSFFMARHYGSTLFYARRYDEALRQLEYARALHPASAAVVDGWISAAYEKKGMLDDAIRYDLREMQENDKHADLRKLRATYRRGDWQSYWALRLEMMHAKADSDPCSGYFVGLAALRAGRQQEAIAALQSAVEQHCYWTILTRTNPLLDELRGHPAYDELVAELHLPPRQDHH